MNKLVKLYTDDDGRQIRNPVWHAVMHIDGCDRTLCGGEAFGKGESNAEFEVMTVQRRGITCRQCLAFIREIKSIKL